MNNGLNLTNIETFIVLWVCSIGSWIVSVHLFETPDNYIALVMSLVLFFIGLASLGCISKIFYDTIMKPTDP